MSKAKHRATNALLRLVECLQTLPEDDVLHFAQRLESLADSAEYLVVEHERNAEAADEQANKAVA